MKIFDAFVKEICIDWFQKRAKGGPISTTRKGAISEDYIARKILKLEPSYAPVKSIRSRTPADIYSVARRNGYWHIMLTQVKGSMNINEIGSLPKADIEDLKTLSEFVKSCILTSDLTSDYRNKEIVISTGYAGVLITNTESGYRNDLKYTDKYHATWLNWKSRAQSSTKAVAN